MNSPLHVADTAHHTSGIKSKKLLASPVIEHSAFVSRLDSSRPGTFRDNASGPFITKEPAGPPRLPERSTPKANQRAIYAQNEQSEPVSAMRTHLRKEQN